MGDTSAAFIGPLKQDRPSSNRLPASRHLALSVESDNHNPSLPPVATVTARVSDEDQRELQFVLESQSLDYLNGQAKLWTSSVVLVDELLDRHLLSLRSGARVVELGSGLALPGMTCAALGADVVVTDVDEVLPLLEHRVAMNFDEIAIARTGKKSIRAAGLRWSIEGAQELVDSLGQLDFVLCSDCVCEPVYGTSWQKLAQCIDTLCGPATVVMVSLERRGESDGVDRFMKALSDSLETELLCEKDVDGALIDVLVARRPKHACDS